MTPEELSKLKQGDVVRHESTGAGYIVLSNRAGVPTVVRSIELHNGSEWSHVYTPTPVAAPAGPDRLEMIQDIEGRGWIHQTSPCYRWATPDGYFYYDLNTAYASRGCHPTASALAAKQRLEVPSIVDAMAALNNLGWSYNDRTNRWISPDGNFRTEVLRLAWEVRDKYKRTAVKSFADARAVLVSAGWKNICGKVWKSPSGALVEGTLAAYKIVTRPSDTTGDCNAS